MKTNVSEYDFRDAFLSSSRKDNFSYEGLTALYDYFIELEESCDTEIDFDMVAICCEYSEYKNLKEIQENYTEIESIEDLWNYTQVIEFDSGIIIQDF